LKTAFRCLIDKHVDLQTARELAEIVDLEFKKHNMKLTEINGNEDAEVSFEQADLS